MNRQSLRHPDRHPPSVFVGYCHPGTVEGLFHDSLMGLLLHDHHHKGLVLNSGGYISIQSGPRIAAGRTQLVDAFLGQKADWLLMLDSDMVFDPDTLYRMLEHAHPKDVPILGGLCFSGAYMDAQKPTLYVLNGEGREMDRLNDYPRDALLKIDATGAACVLIHRSVFERMAEKFPRPYPWFQEIVMDGHEYGEDVTFFLRANSLGIPTHVHTGIEVGHIKPAVLNQASYEMYRDRLRQERAELREVAS